VQVDSFAIRLRKRSNMEATDLGVRLCQNAARGIFPCYWMVLAPVTVLSLATFEIATWLPSLLLWCAKPWLDRTILFVLSRAAFGQSTRPQDVWSAQRQVWWQQLFLTWTWRRLSPWRSFTQAVYQLEGASIWRVRKRVLQIRAGSTNTALLMTSAFGLAELALAIGLISLVVWLIPTADDFNWVQALFGRSPDTGAVTLIATVAYIFVIAFLEPFYVAAGFALYLNRRVELEAWDIEQEFRRAFAQ
jgi:hypothetical protein